MNYKIITLILFCSLLINAKISFSQNDFIKKYHLTHELSPTEKELMKSYPKSFSETPPPTGEVRNIAEWEPMESVLIAYYYGFGIPYSLIAEMSEDCNVTTIVSGSSEENTVRNYFTSNGVNLANCNFVYQDPDSWWTRDYSPWYIAIDDNEVAIVNFPYNRPRPNDNDVPILMADSLNIDLYGMDVTHTGGNYMCDGYGAAASTDLIWDEESQTPAQINEKMLNYLGIQNYHVTADPLDDYIKHIDCWGKFLDVDKILITQVPVSDYRYDDYEALATYFSEQNCSWGYPYEVIRVQAADYDDYDVNPYSNSLILNDKVFVPQTGSDLDDDAIATYEAAMPGYEIIGVYSSGWYNTDALHCRTHGVADREMLYIKHYPLHGNVSFQTNFTIEAEVVSYGGSPITSGFPKLFYRQNGGTWEEDIMTNTGGNTFSAQINALGGENDVEYYIYAKNNNNKSESHPLIGENDPHTFSYSGINVLVSSNSEICIGTSTGNIVLTNYSGTITDWEKRLVGGSWQSIGYTNDTYSETPLSAGVWEYRVELDNTNYSTTALIIVHDNPLVGNASSNSNEICEGEDFELSLSSYTGNILWQISEDEITWIDIEDGDTSPYTISGLNSDAYFRAKSYNNVCDDVFSNHVFVTVNDAPVGGTASPDNSQICTGSSATLTLSSYEGSIQWQESDNGTDWNSISGANSESYTSDALTDNTYYRANVSLGLCADDQSNAVEISIYEPPVAGFTFNANNQDVTFTNTSTNATSYSWDFGDGNNSTLENPVHIYDASGIYPVSLSAINDICPDNIYNENIEVNFVGVSEINSEIKIIPNPNNGKFILKTLFDKGIIRIININGLEIYTTKLISNTNVINISDFATGIYLIKIENKNTSYYKKLIVK